MKIGCVGWAWYNELEGFEEPIRRVAALGFEGIELVGNRENLRKYYTPERIKALRELIQSNGLELTEFVSFTREVNHPDEKEREKVIADFERACDIAVEMGTKIVNLICPNPAGASLASKAYELKFTLHLPKDYSYEKDWETFVNSMKKCLKIAEDRDLRIAMESFAYSLCCTSDAFLKLYEDVGSERLGVNLDTGHLIAQNQYLTIAVYKLKDRIFHTHIKDGDGMIRGGLLAGWGVIDFEEFILALKKVGYDYVLSVEVEGTDKTDRYSREAKEHLEKILNGTW